RDTPSRMLSGGMKRRLMIARALVHQPQLLILDEPTAGVDIELRRSMWQFLQEINRQGTTIILTTHYLEEAESLCRNIAIIDHGRILENTSKRALLDKLHLETFVLDTDGLPEMLPELPGYTFRVNDEKQLEVDVPRAQGLNAVFRLLDGMGLQVQSLRARSGRLEELFLALVERGSADLTASGRPASSIAEDASR
ncbi:MAG: ABC transporter ATP-binding protein, partial [Gammaproteobacteria bacterium]|nr:ABC transporter ATP-binding protein [Gammaproteobacteria bacterium]